MEAKGEFSELGRRLLITDMLQAAAEEQQRNPALWLLQKRRKPTLSPRPRLFSFCKQHAFSHRLVCTLAPFSSFAPPPTLTLKENTSLEEIFFFWAQQPSWIDAVVFVLCLRIRLADAVVDRAGLLA